MYLTVKKTIEVEENFHVKQSHLTPEHLKKGLDSGDFNIIKVEAHESLRWVVSKSGRRVAVLEHDGGFSSEHREIKVYAQDGVRPWGEEVAGHTVVFE